METVNGLDLFSGIGGIPLALREWVTPVAYCEIDLYCQAVLFSRMHDGTIPSAPIWDDVRTLGRGELDAAGIGPIDIVTGGFPCTDISVAGLGKGLEGKQSGLFFEIVRLIGELRPRFVFLENVPAILLRGIDRVLGEMAGLGYDCRWAIVSAASVGAPHMRRRWWCLAHADSQRREEHDAAPRIGGMGFNSGGTAQAGLFRQTESPVVRRTDGVPDRSHRIRALGNSVVPQAAKEAFEILSGVRVQNGNGVG